MTFEEWDRTHYPEQPKNILATVKRGQRRAGWNAGQEEMQERCLAICDDVSRGNYHEGADICEERIRALPVE